MVLHDTAATLERVRPAQRKASRHRLEHLAGLLQRLGSREIVLVQGTVPDGRGFAARCPLDAAKSDSARPDLDEPCRVTFRHRGMDVNIRFPRAIIADWELMLGGVRRAIEKDLFVAGQFLRTFCA